MLLNLTEKLIYAKKSPGLILVYHTLRQCCQIVVLLFFAEFHLSFLFWILVLCWYYLVGGSGFWGGSYSDFIYDVSNESRAIVFYSPCRDVLPAFLCYRFGLNVLWLRQWWRSYKYWSSPRFNWCFPGMLSAVVVRELRGVTRSGRRAYTWAWLKIKIKINLLFGTKGMHTKDNYTVHNLETDKKKNNITTLRM